MTDCGRKKIPNAKRVHQNRARIDRLSHRPEDGDDDRRKGEIKGLLPNELARDENFTFPPPQRPVLLVSNDSIVANPSPAGNPRDFILTMRLFAAQNPTSIRLPLQPNPEPRLNRRCNLLRQRQNLLGVVRALHDSISASVCRDEMPAAPIA